MHFERYLVAQVILSRIEESQNRRRLRKTFLAMTRRVRVQLLSKLFLQVRNVDMEDWDDGWGDDSWSGAWGGA